jgi:hypothetical protein
MEMSESERRNDNLYLPLPTAHHSTNVKFFIRNVKLFLIAELSTF